MIDAQKVNCTLRQILQDLNWYVETKNDLMGKKVQKNYLHKNFRGLQGTMILTRAKKSKNN